MKKTALSLLFFCILKVGHSQIFIGNDCTVSFFSATSMENIDAVNKISKPVLNSETGEVLFRIQNTAFKFKSQLMEEHFNENYMESEKYPTSTFKGKVNEKIDFTINGENKVTVSGKLTMHGVDKDVTIEGIITIKDGQVTLHSKFPIKLDDYKIKVPSLVGVNIAESIDVTVDAVLIPYKKK